MTLQVTSLGPARGPGRGPLALALLPILHTVAGPVLHKAGRAAPAGKITQPLYLRLLLAGPLTQPLNVKLYAAVLQDWL